MPVFSSCASIQMFDDKHAQIQPFVTIHKRRFCRWVPSACQLLRQTAFKGHLSPFLFSSSSSDLHPASSPAVTLSRLLVIQKSWTTHHCACEVKFCFAQTMNWKRVVTLADAQINVTPSKFNIFRIFQPHCTSVDVSDCVLYAFQWCQMCEHGKAHCYIWATSNI